MRFEIVYFRTKIQLHPSQRLTMRRLSQILSLSLFALACLKPALAADPAGIVLFMESNGEVFLLLADHADSSTRG